MSAPPTRPFIVSVLTLPHVQPQWWGLDQSSGTDGTDDNRGTNSSSAPSRHPRGASSPCASSAARLRHARAAGLIEVSMTMHELTCPSSRAQPLAREQNDADRLSCVGCGSKIAPPGRALGGAV